MPKVLVLIVTHNAMKWIQRCLESVLDSQGQSLQFVMEVMVVDNASDDGTSAYISKHFPSVRVQRQLKNFGFGRANNLGLNYAVRHEFDHVFLLNQDAYVEKGTIAELVQAQMEHPEYLVVSPVHMDGNGEDLDSKFAGYIADNRVLQEAVGLFGREKEKKKKREGEKERRSEGESETKHKCESTQSLGVDREWEEKHKHRKMRSLLTDIESEASETEPSAKERRGENEKERRRENEVVVPVDFVNAAAWMLSRNALRLVGGFHPAIFMYAEDNNYVHRIHHAGFLVGVLPSSTIYHDRQDRPVPEGTAKLFRNFKINASITITNPTISGWKKLTKTTKLLFKASGSRLKRGHPDALILFFRMLIFSIGISINALKTPTPTNDFPFLETSTENK